LLRTLTTPADTSIQPAIVLVPAKINMPVPSLIT